MYLSSFKFLFFPNLYFHYKDFIFCKLFLHFYLYWQSGFISNYLKKKLEKTKNIVKINEKI